ncbi:MAG TPA: hypothetical protein VMR54_15725 [Thermoanaerobaculia bacterium]|nr:hypothetical protein [Thermoanaerobaculia bacterium]
MTFWASPPAIGRTKIWAFASFPDPASARNASRSPDGDQRGDETLLRPNVKGRATPVAMSTKTSSLSHRLSFTFARATTQAIDLPPGAIRGSETRTI